MHERVLVRGSVWRPRGATWVRRGTCALCWRSAALWGDFKTKAELGGGIIISQPDTYTFNLNETTLLVVAVSDGVTSVMGDDSICSQVCTFLNQAGHENDPTYAARELVKYAVGARESADNCSAAVVALRSSPPPLPPRPRRRFGAAARQ
mmetsp:Transcript_31257/g.69570  ORF Transcript_31257/g.69570 Transcript_31257/m.69570 type:complete len:150 (-) Transcript_31257:861-1310(-)